LKSAGEKLGMSVRGGAKSKAGNPLDKTDEGIFVSKVLKFFNNIIYIYNKSFLN